jgi:uncharacterized protein
VTVVIDSSVWISALNYGGTPRLALERAYVTSQIAICNTIVDEIVKALADKMRWERQRVQQSLQIYLEDAQYVPVSGAISGVCRDPKDDMVLECAVLARAELVITGDKDLLTLGEYEGIRMLSPRDYLEEADLLYS